MKCDIKSRGSKVKCALLGIVILLVVFLLVPLLVPISYIKPEVEMELSQFLGRTVQIGSLDISLLPSPRIFAKDVSITNEMQQGVNATRITIIPDFSAFINGEVVLKHIDLQGLVLEHTFLEAWVEELNASNYEAEPATLRIKRLTADSLHLKWEKDRLIGPYALDLEFSSKGDLDQLHFFRQDKTAHIYLLAKEKGYEVHLSAINWQLPFQPFLMFDSLNANGVLYKDRLVLKHISADAYDGDLNGSAEFNWENDLDILADLQMQTMNSESIMRAFSYPVIDGLGSGDVQLVFSGDSVDQLLENMRVEGSLQLANGAIYDLDNMNQLLRFDTLQITGVLDGDNLKIDSLDANAYSGSVRAKGEIDWQTDWRINAQISGEDVHAEPLLDDLVGKKMISGRFTGDSRLQLYAKNASELFDQPYVEGYFNFEDGVIYKADLKKAASNFSNEDVSNGQTPFDELKGNMLIQNHAIKLTELQIKSPDLVANGNVDISADNELDGMVDVGLRKASSVLSIPVLVSGTTNQPDLHPTKGVLVGGTLGTTLLGPILGTAIGIKIGSFFSKFSSKSDSSNNHDNDLEEDY